MAGVMAGVMARGTARGTARVTGDARQAPGLQLSQPAREKLVDLRVARPAPDLPEGAGCSLANRLIAITQPKAQVGGVSHRTDLGQSGDASQAVCWPRLAGGGERLRVRQRRRVNGSHQQHRCQ